VTKKNAPQEKFKMRFGGCDWWSWLDYGWMDVPAVSHHLPGLMVGQYSTPCGVMVG